VQQKMRGEVGTVEGLVIPNAGSASVICLLHIVEGPMLWSPEWGYEII
jgi:hypothetical protein